MFDNSEVLTARVAELVGTVSVPIERYEALVRAETERNILLTAIKNNEINAKIFVEAIDGAHRMFYGFTLEEATKC